MNEEAFVHLLSLRFYHTCDFQGEMATDRM